jgi:hypothetical protein
VGAIALVTTLRASALPTRLESHAPQPAWRGTPSPLACRSSVTRADDAHLFTYARVRVRVRE